MFQVWGLLIVVIPLCLKFVFSSLSVVTQFLGFCYHVCPGFHGPSCVQSFFCISIHLLIQQLQMGSCYWQQTQGERQGRPYTVWTFTKLNIVLNLYLCLGFQVLYKVMQSQVICKNDALGFEVCLIFLWFKSKWTNLRPLQNPLEFILLAPLKEYKIVTKWLSESVWLLSLKGRKIIRDGVPKKC